MTDYTPEPSAGEVHANPNTPTWQAAIRLVILALGMVLAAAGFPELAAKVNGFVSSAGLIAGLVAAGWGLYATRKINKKAAVMAAVVPDRVATLK